VPTITQTPPPYLNTGVPAYLYTCIPLLQNEPILVRKRGLVRSGDSQVVPVPAFEPRNPVAKFQNEPILSHRGYVGLRRRAAPRGRGAGCACQNEPIFKKSSPPAKGESRAAGRGYRILYAACRYSALLPFTIYHLTFLRNEPNLNKYYKYA
jgi:hypothetical protein